MFTSIPWRRMLLACAAMVALAQSAAAQPALERLEKKLRGDEAAVDPPPLAPAERGYLGVVTEDEQGRGARVAEVAPGGPAEAAGLQPGDLIIAVGRAAVRGNDDLAAALRNAPPDARLSFDVVRTIRQPGAEPRSETIRLDVTLGRRRRDAAGPSYLGVLTRPVDAATRVAQRMPNNRGAVVTEIVPDSPAAQAGLQPGDVIVALGEDTVNSPAQLRQRVAQHGARDEVELLLYRAGQLQRQAVALGAPPVPQPDPPPGIAPAPAALPPPAIAAPGNGSRQRIEALEQRVRQLEQRLAELEKKLAGQP